MVSITFDRDVAGEDERALACHRALLDALALAGYHSYRLGIQAMRPATRIDSAAPLLERLKQACDPQHILATGRYGLGTRPIAKSRASD